MFRNNKNNRRYNKYKKHNAESDDCPFCDLSDKSIIVEERKHCFVRRNVFPYSFWDYHDTVEQLMVIPRRHINRLSELTSAELKELMSVILGYEEDGYDIYARSMNNKVRTAPHQHTHLIKTGDRTARAAFYINRPYFFKRFM